jgi:hypothetical protein
MYLPRRETSPIGFCIAVGISVCCAAYRARRHREKYSWCVTATSAEARTYRQCFNERCLASQ